MSRDLLRIHEFGDPILRGKTRNLRIVTIRSPRLRKLTRQMFAALRKVNGAGLAAPQVGSSLRLAVITI